MANGKASTVQTVEYLMGTYEKYSGVMNEFLQSPAGKNVVEKFCQVFGNAIPRYKREGITDQQMEIAYAAGHNCYEAGRYDEAIVVFKKLFSLNQKEIKYIKSLAASYLKVGDYEMAILNYGLCNMLDCEDPTYLYFTGFSHMKLMNWEGAKACFEKAIQLCGDEIAYSEIKERSQGLLKVSQSKLEKTDKAKADKVDKEDK